VTEKTCYSERELQPSKLRVAGSSPAAPTNQASGLRITELAPTNPDDSASILPDTFCSTKVQRGTLKVFGGWTALSERSVAVD
jgi:hypothetical protein